MRKTINIVKMRTTNCQISIFWTARSSFTLFLMCVQFILICRLQKKLFGIFATKVGYVLMAMYVYSFNVFCQGSDTSWGYQSLGSASQRH